VTAVDGPGVGTLPRAVLAGVVACFFLSGATGLVYEVLWIRMLGLVFGHTVFAVTTVLTAFMAGLGLGSWVFGRVADRQARPLRVYGLLEIGVGLFCLLVPLLLPWVELVYRALARSLGLSFFAFSLAQFVLVLVVFLPPTTLMGATLPILSRLFATEAGTLGRRVGLLYALNTLGAVVGCGLAGYVLLPALGMRATLTLAAAVNLVLGVLIVLADRRLSAPAPAADAPAADATPAGEPPSLAATVVAAALAVAGAASMIYEVAWVRALSLVIGSSTYAFTAMLVAFLLGLALGSALFSRLFGARPLGPAAFGALQLGVGLTALGILPLFDRLPDVVVGALSVSLSPSFVLVVEVALAVAAMLVPTVLIGAGFPCAVQAAARGPARIGGDVGRLYALNTLGAIVGTVVAGFALVPMAGAQGAVKIAILLNVVLGVGLLLASRRTLAPWQALAGLALAAIVVAGLVRVPAWDRAIMASGASVYTRQYQRFAGHGGVARAAADTRLLFYRDGLTATVSVHREGPTTFLRVNGKTDASNGVDMHMQLMLGHLPMLLHPDARSAMVVGLGSGVTVGAVAAHPVTRVDVVEIEPAVVEAAAFFQRENRDALRDHRVHLAIGDARNVLLASDRRWDVIVSEPSNPWIGGVATLFSAEFYALARSRLAPGGVMVQWIDGYGMRPEDFKMIVRTFSTAFPAATLWHGHGIADFLLVGAAEPRPLDLARVQAAWEASPALREDFARLGFRTSSAFLADFLLAEPDVARLTLGADVNTDDLLPLEFSAPKSLHRDTAALNYRMVRAFRTRDLPLLAGTGSAGLDTAAGRHAVGAALLRKGLATEAVAHLDRALALDPAHGPALLDLGRAQLGLELPMRAVETLQAAARQDPRSAEPHALLARVWQAQRMPARALEAIGTAVRLAPEEPAYREQHAGLLVEHGRLADAVEEYLVARARRPRDAALLDGLATAYTRLGRVPEALAALEEAVAAQPDDGALLHRLGRTYLALNQPGPAVQVLTRAVTRAPTLAQAHADLGVAHLGTGDPFAAMTALDRALVVDPAHAGAATLRGEINARLHGGKSP
jgi:spermidine synthase